MRQAFRDATVALMDKDERLVVLLGDIGVYAFSEGAKRHPNRLLNFGIMEQSMVGLPQDWPQPGLFRCCTQLLLSLSKGRLSRSRLTSGIKIWGVTWLASEAHSITLR